MSLTAMSSLESARKKFFMNSAHIVSRKKESNVQGSGGRNQSNSHQLAGIGEKKIFHELDVHHVKKVGIKRFCAQEAEMSRTAMSSLEAARRKFLMTRRTSCLQRRNQTFLASGGRNESNRHQLAGMGEKKIFHELGAHRI